MLITVVLVIITFVLFTLLLLPKEFKLGFSSKAKEYDPDSKLKMLEGKDKKDKKFFLKPMDDYDSSSNSLLETEGPPTIKNYQATICMLIGTLSFFLIFIIEECFTSHYYDPVRSLVNTCEDETSLALLYSKLLGTLP